MARKSLFHFILFLQVLLSSGQPIIRPVTIYSGFTDIQIDEYDVFFFDLSCFQNIPGTFSMDVDQPDFQDSVSGAYLYVSNGPSKGQNAPYPDPGDNTTYQWSTINGTGSPYSGIVIGNAAGFQLYVTIDCPNGELCTYSLVTEYDPSNKKREMATKPNQVSYPVASSLPKDLVQKPLFFSNTMELDGNVAYNTYNQSQILMCQSALIAQFGKTIPLCLIFTVVGGGPDFIFYQQVSVNPSPGQNVQKWETRKPDKNPYVDFSGRAKISINRWISLPVTAPQIPPLLYHTIYGFGGKGLTPPFNNPYTAYYEITTQCP